MNEPGGEVTRILAELRRGNREAECRLIPLVYAELRQIAAGHMRREAADHSLQPTALVHEAYLKLIRIEEVDWQSRSHFFAVSATLMRRILVDHARAKQAHKRGSGASLVAFDEALIPQSGRTPEVLALDEALDRLCRLDERQAKIVEMRFFAGMSEEEVGEALGVSARTVKRDWRAAKAWMYRELTI